MDERIVKVYGPQDIIDELTRLITEIEPVEGSERAVRFFTVVREMMVMQENIIKELYQNNRELRGLDRLPLGTEEEEEEACKSVPYVKRTTH